MQGLFNIEAKYLKGVGEDRANLLKKLAIFSAGDLLYHFPKKYEDRREKKPFLAYKDGDRAFLTASLVSFEERFLKKGLSLIKALFKMEDGNCFYGIWYNQSYLKKELLVGELFSLVGKISFYRGETNLQIEEFEIFKEESINMHRIVPFYLLTAKISQKVLRNIIYEALIKWATELREFMPLDILKKYDLPFIWEALKDIHFPKSKEAYQKAVKRFVLEELFFHQLLILWQRKEMVSCFKRHNYLKEDKWEKAFLKNLPFSLTLAQKKVWGEIKEDMEKDCPMYRLLQGDVGSGKTVICFLALLKAVHSGFQGVLMAPTEILAEQHYKALEDLALSQKLKIVLLKGNMPRKQRQALLEEILKGEIQIVVGTHALLQNDVEFENLALIIIDEQHRFGVRQRAIMHLKGKNPDVLVMTATPIPRTLAMGLYGDLEISTILELPLGRKPIKTYWERHQAWNEICQRIEKEALLGRQAYIVCPLVEESEKMDLASAKSLYEKCVAKDLKSCKVGLLHGKMKSEEKEEVISSFQRGELEVLVSTTLVEVGINVVNTTMMVIVDAHRFGLAQLHQLRGRVGRGEQQAYCYLVSDAYGEEVEFRLRAMCESNDGFSLAEKDLQLRGPGEFWGTRQSGLSVYKIANPFIHKQALEKAREEARAILAKDANLINPENKLLLLEMQRRFGSLLVSSFA